MFSFGFYHAGRSRECVHFSKACTEANAISVAGVFGENSLTGQQANILGATKGGVADGKRTHMDGR